MEPGYSLPGIDREVSSSCDAATVSAKPAEMGGTSLARWSNERYDADNTHASKRAILRRGTKNLHFPLDKSVKILILKGNTVSQ